MEPKKGPTKVDIDLREFNELDPEDIPVDEEKISKAYMLIMQINNRGVDLEECYNSVIDNMGLNPLEQIGVGIMLTTGGNVTIKKVKG